MNHKQLSNTNKEAVECVGVIKRLCIFSFDRFDLIKHL